MYQTFLPQFFFNYKFKNFEKVYYFSMKSCELTHQ